MEQRLALSAEEVDLLRNVLNEVLNGFEVPEFDRVMGMSETELKQLFSEFDLSEQSRGISLDKRQVIAFRKALRETLRELGSEEFYTRTGYDFEMGQATYKNLAAFSNSE